MNVEQVAEDNENKQKIEEMEFEASSDVSVSEIDGCE